MRTAIMSVILCSVMVGYGVRQANADAKGMSSTCPMQVPGTHVSVQDAPNGAVIAFETTGDVSQLRQKVHAMAARMGSGTTACCGMTTIIPSSARAEDIKGGARIVLTPKDPSQLAALRDHVREHVATMTRGQCPMMGRAT